jgi:hypothetical protein
MTEPAGPRCPRCSKWNAVGQSFYGNCGLDLRAASAPDRWEHPTPPPRDSRGGRRLGQAISQGFGWGCGCLLLIVIVPVVLAILLFVARQ